MSATTALELTIVGLGVLAAVLGLAWLGHRPSGWERAISEHLDATGRYPTVGELRSGRVGWDATRPAPAPSVPAGPATVTVTSVDGRPVAGSTR